LLLVFHAICTNQFSKTNQCKHTTSYMPSSSSRYSWGKAIMTEVIKGKNTKYEGLGFVWVIECKFVPFMIQTWKHARCSKFQFFICSLTTCSSGSHFIAHMIRRRDAVDAVCEFGRMQFFVVQTVKVAFVQVVTFGSIIITNIA